jgi:putative peptide zinc metalloprotease protein
MSLPQRPFGLAPAEGRVGPMISPIPPESAASPSPPESPVSPAHAATDHGAAATQPSPATTEPPGPGRHLVPSSESPERAPSPVVLVAPPEDDQEVALADPPMETQPEASPVVAPAEETQVPLTAAAFEGRMFAAVRPAPTRGWRRLVHAATGGQVNLGPGAAERARLQTLARLRTPIVGSRRVVVMSRKGGVGKTTITLALGSTFAVHRGDRVVAVDANPDAGNLVHRMAARTGASGRSITDILADAERINTYSELQSYTSQSPESRLEVIASDDDPHISDALSRSSYHRVVQLLDHYYNLIVLDTGTGILDSANQGLIAEADQLVLVLRPGLDGARAAAQTLDWLDEHGFGPLVARAVVVLNGMRRGVGVPLGEVRAHFGKRCATVLEVPWDKALERGGQTELSDLAQPTRDALIEVAAAVADNFGEAYGTR